MAWIQLPVMQRQAINGDNELGFENIPTGYTFLWDDAWGTPENPTIDLNQPVQFPDGSIGTPMQNAGNDENGNPQWRPWQGFQGQPGTPGTYQGVREWQGTIDDGGRSGIGGFVDFAQDVAAGPIGAAAGAAFLPGLVSQTGLTGMPATAAQGAIQGFVSSGGDPQAALSGGLNSLAFSTLMSNVPQPTPSVVDTLDTSGFSAYEPGSFNAGAFGSGGTSMFESVIPEFDYSAGGSFDYGVNSPDLSNLFAGSDTSYDANISGMSPSDVYRGLGITPNAVTPFGDFYGDPAQILKSLISSGMPYAQAARLIAGLAGAGGAATGGATTGGSTVDRLIRSILGETAGGLASEAINGLGGFGNIASKAAATAPILAAINYAKNQGLPDTSQLEGIGASIPTSFNTNTSGLQSTMDAIPTTFNTDTSRLRDVFDQFNPEALAGQFDMATAAGRGQLTSDLARRGVSGSSFGNMDITNFNTTRDIGRSQLIQGGLTSQAEIASRIAALEQADREKQLAALGLRGQIGGQIAGISAADQNRLLTAGQLRSTNAATALQAKLNAQKNQFDLYGRSLLALGSVFSPRSPLLGS